MLLIKFANHPSVIKIDDVYKKYEDRFSFSFEYLKQDEIRKKLSQITVKKSTSYDYTYLEEFYV